MTTTLTKTKTVIQHVLSRLRDIGIDSIFGVPGDYAFTVNDAICQDKDIRWIGCCNELNAAYAADGYARIKGVAAVNTTYGVGELSAMNGIAGSYAENLPVFHLVGMPQMAVQQKRSIVHHTLGNGEYNLFRNMFEPVVCAHAILTPQNAAYETERLIAEALYHRRPVYMGLPSDLAAGPVLNEAQPAPAASSDPKNLEEATKAIVSALQKAKTVCILPGSIIARARLQKELQKLIDKTGIKFATMFMDKTIMDETHPNYIGMYVGTLMNKEVQEYVEGCDRVLSIGTLMTDFNTGAFTARLDPEKEIKIGLHGTHVDGKTYLSVELVDLLAALTEKLSGIKSSDFPHPQPVTVPAGKDNDPITADALYPRWANFIKQNDIVFAETGTSSMGLCLMPMPKGATFYNQTLWGSIGWATPAAFGAAIAAPNKRVVLITGEGSHQLTAQEISSYGRYGVKPVIFVLNNSGYLIERLLCKNPKEEYNDIASWRYTELPKALGCDNWYTAKVSTVGELDKVLKEVNQSDKAAYIEVVTDAYAASQLAQKIHDSLKSLYP